MSADLIQPPAEQDEHDEPRKVDQPHDEPLVTNRAGAGLLAAWVLSLAFHVGALTATLFFFFPLVDSGPMEPSPSAFARVVGDVDAPLSGPIDAPPVPVDFLGRTGSSDQPVAAFQPSASLTGTAMEQLAGAGLPGERGEGLGVIGDASRAGWGIGAGGGDIARGGLGLGGGASPGFFGLRSSAPGVRSIVYVVDRSGSMVSTFPAVRLELRRSISELRRSQKFHVVFFNSGEPLENPPRKAVNAIEGNKSEFYEFLESVTPTGGTSPERAMRRALELEPDIVYFLSDGLFDADLVEKLVEWNRDRKSRIYTIAYIDQSGRRLLETIARQHGGEFKFVTEDELP